MDPIARYVEHLQSLFGTDEQISIEPGRRFLKIVRQGKWQRSVHSFIEKDTLLLHKAAGWKAPAKGARYHLVHDWDILQPSMDRYGSYLYKRSWRVNLAEAGEATA